MKTKKRLPIKERHSPLTDDGRDVAHGVKCKPALICSH